MLRNPFRKLDQRELSRSSDALKTQNDYFKIVNRRIFIFSIIILLLFSGIVVRLLFLQVRDQEEYSDKLVAYSKKQESSSTPRGQMYDRNGKLVVKTVSSHNITYFPLEDISSEDEWELAQKFAKQFSYESGNMTASDYQDLYMFLHVGADGKKDGGRNLLKGEEQQLQGEKAEKLIRERVTEEMVEEMTDEATRNAFAVYLLMNKAPSESTKVIVEDASDEDVAYLIEHKEDFPGFDVDLGSWKREYPYKNTLRDVFGSVSTTKQGVPAEERDYYEALGYSLTDRVGKSGLEKQYEALLSGTPRVNEITYDENGAAVLNEVSSGKKGYDLQLTIDIDLQKAVDKQLQSIVKKYSGTKGREAFNQAYVILINPKTGEILSMNGAIKNEDGSITDFASGAYLNSYVVGSVVKGASVYMFLSEGVQTKSSTEYDSPMNIAGSTRSSYTSMGTVNAVSALEKSSNVYMWKSTIKLAKGSYSPGKALGIDEEQTEATLQIMRQYYTMFGLGTKTGLDVPNEASGIMGYTDVAGNLLDYSIGQFDSYTPIQLAQYVSMIANGGTRIEPKLVNEATEINSGYTIYENKTSVLGTLSGKASDLDTVREGFRACVTGNHCGVELNTMDKDIAAKTGTAQVVVSDGEHPGKYTNTSEIGFAPYDDPEVAFVCTAPTSAADSSSQEVNICSNIIMPRVMEEYYKLYD